MNPFKVGDKVKCIDSDKSFGALDHGKTYTICGVDFKFVDLVDVPYQWHHERFELDRDNEPTLLYDKFTAVTELANSIHADNVKAGWWDQADNPLIVATKLALIHSEVSEALEGDRKGLMDDHLPQHTMLACELADTFIRLADLAGFLKIDLGAVVRDKTAYNAKRADHKPENRQAKGGKKY